MNHRGFCYKIAIETNVKGNAICDVSFIENIDGITYMMNVSYSQILIIADPC